MSNFKTVREKIDGLQERTNEDIEILGNRHFGVLTQNGQFAFGPVFFSRDDAEAFIAYLDKPVLDYSMSDLHLAYSKFKSEGTPQDRKLKGVSCSYPWCEKQSTDEREIEDPDVGRFFTPVCEKHAGGKDD